MLGSRLMFCGSFAVALQPHRIVWWGTVLCRLSCLGYESRRAGRMEARLRKERSPARTSTWPNWERCPRPAIGQRHHRDNRRYCQCACGAGTDTPRWGFRSPAVFGRHQRRRGAGGVTFQTVGFYKDHDGTVHLRGVATIGKEGNPTAGLIFQLPPGYRPASGVTEVFTSIDETIVFVIGSNVTAEVKNVEGDVLATREEGQVALLSEITFRAEKLSQGVSTVTMPSAPA